MDQVLKYVLLAWLTLTVFQVYGQKKVRVRDAGIIIGVLNPGPLNAITDVPGVKVGHKTVISGEQVRTGVTAILPDTGNIFQLKIPAAIFTGNGFGKLAGSTQVQELGLLETPIVLTNTLAVPTAMQAVIEYTLQQPGNEAVQSVNALVGETNDGSLNDIRSFALTKKEVTEAILSAKMGPVTEGNVGAGTGTVCFGWKGGIGTASRVLPKEAGGYTIGVLVQTNFGGVLQINGLPAGQWFNQYYLNNLLSEKPDGSCMIVVATNAPLDARNLQRLAKRAFMGLAKTGGIASNGSGDYVIAFSTATQNRVSYNMDNPVSNFQFLHNDAISPIFMGAIEATEEAILNSLFAAETMTGKNGKTVEAFPVNAFLQKMKQIK